MRFTIDPNAIFKDFKIYLHTLVYNKKLLKVVSLIVKKKILL